MNINKCSPAVQAKLLHRQTVQITLKKELIHIISLEGMSAREKVAVENYVGAAMRRTATAILEEEGTDFLEELVKRGLAGYRAYAKKWKADQEEYE